MLEPNFRQWFDAGYADLLPVIPPGVEINNAKRYAMAGKSPGVRYANGKWGGLVGWNKLHATTADLATWQSMGASVGLRRGDVFLLDVDIYDEATAAMVEARATERFGEAPLRVGQWPKRGLLYRSDGTVKQCSLRLDLPGGNNLIEIPPQAVIEGVHAKTGKPYEWRRKPVPFAELPVVSGAQMSAFIDEMRALLPVANGSESSAGDRNEIDQNALKATDFDVLRSAVEAIPNVHAQTGYDWWVRLAYALRGACQDDYELGLELFEDFSARTDLPQMEEDPSAIYRRTSAPFALGADYIYAQAEKHGWDGRAKLYFEELPDEVESPFAQAEAKEAQTEAAAARRTLPTITLQEASDTALSSNAKPLVHGLLDQETLNMLYGASNTGKTFVAMDMAFCIAHGLEWAGQRTEQTGVLYVAAEGGHGIKKRARALTMHRYAGVKVSSAFNLIPSPIDLYDPKGDLEPLLQTIAALARSGQKVGLVVLDTLSRVLPGGKEDTQDMGVFVARATTIKTLMGCAVLVIHHSGKNEAQGARGSSVLRAAVDTEMEVKDGRVSITKQRDHEPLPDLQFTLSGVVVGRDELGAEVSSAVVHFGQGGAVAEQAPTEMEVEVLEALAAYSGEHPNSKGAPPSGIKDILSREGSDISVEGVRAHLKRLARKGLVAMSGRGIWVEKVRKVQLSSSQNQVDPTVVFEDLDAQSGQATGQGIFD